jgi:DNA-binding response OmpR family regulator
VSSDRVRRKPLNTDHRSLNTDHCFLLTVKDTGPGIPGELREKIFDRFYQVDASHTREHEGTGIGLALTKELVELHHGEIAVESEVGRGATFIVRLPLGRTHLREEEVISDQARGMEQGAMEQFVESEDRELKLEDRESKIEERTTNDQQPETGNQILMIEDNRDVRAYIRQYLEPEFKIIEAADGEEGVALALETIPDLIICDVMMPKRDGYEVCRMLKTDEKTSHVPVIMLTAKADRESKVYGLETGADDYVIKPFDARELLARVFNLIKQRQQLRERFGREITLQPKDIAVTSMDEQFLTRAMQIVEEHMSDEELSVEFLAHKIGMSRVHLNRKLRGLTDQTANEFIRTLRLKRAAQLLEKKSATVLEIAYEVGFSNPSYFAECFEKQFGVLPSKFAEREKS